MSAASSQRLGHIMPKTARLKMRTLNSRRERPWWRKRAARAITDEAICAEVNHVVRFNPSQSHCHRIKDRAAEGRKNIVHRADLGFLQAACDRYRGDLDDIFGMGADNVHTEDFICCFFIDDFD